MPSRPPLGVVRGVEIAAAALACAEWCGMRGGVHIIVIVMRVQEDPRLPQNFSGSSCCPVACCCGLS